MYRSVRPNTRRRFVNPLESYEECRYAFVLFTTRRSSPGISPIRFPFPFHQKLIRVISCRLHQHSAIFCSVIVAGANDPFNGSPARDDITLLALKTATLIAVPVPLNLHCGRSIDRLLPCPGREYFGGFSTVVYRRRHMDGHSRTRGRRSH